MKKTLFFFFFFFSFLFCFSQEIEVLPISWGLDLNDQVIPIELPSLDLETIKVEDSINDLDKSIPWRYGIERSISLNFNESGEWIDIPYLGRVWKGAIKSTGAINLSVNFSNFYLPEGATLHLYNDDRSDLSRTYTHAQNGVNNKIGSWFIEGDLIWLEYFEPYFVTEVASLQIGSVIHGYRMGKVNDLAGIGSDRGLNDSGGCNYDVNCPIGVDFDEKKDIVKKAVALLNLGNGYLCSASLMNNTRGDKKPFLLTANHCLEISDPTFWTIRFNWMSPSPICGTGDDSVDLQTNFTMSGAEVRANSSLSDFALVEMFNPVPDSWDIAFAGWDNRDINPEYEVGIHHPNGDIMKICRDDSGAVKETANGTEVWLIGGVSVGTGDGWEIGTTESGSSGSPLFDQNGRVIGQLFAGQSFCDGLQNNNDYDIYGRFGISWDSGPSAQSRLREWLDPTETGASTVETLQNILGVPNNELTGTLEIYPNPASTSITVMNKRYPNLSYRFFTILGQELINGSMSNTMNTIDIRSFSDGIYFLYLLDEDSNSSITKKILIDR